MVKSQRPVISADERLHYAQPDGLNDPIVFPAEIIRNLALVFDVSTTGMACFLGMRRHVVWRKIHESWRDHWIIGKTREVKLQRGKDLPSNRVCLNDRSVLVTLAQLEVETCTLAAGHDDLLTVSRLQDLAFGEMDGAVELVGHCHLSVLENEHSPTVLQAVGLVNIACQRVGGKSG